MFCVSVFNALWGLGRILPLHGVGTGSSEFITGISDVGFWFSAQVRVAICFYFIAWVRIVVIL